MLSSIHATRKKQKNGLSPHHPTFEASLLLPVPLGTFPNPWGRVRANLRRFESHFKGREPLIIVFLGFPILCVSSSCRISTKERKEAVNERPWLLTRLQMLATMSPRRQKHT